MGLSDNGEPFCVFIIRTQKSRDTILILKFKKRE